MLDCKRRSSRVERQHRGGREDPPQEGSRRGRQEGRPRRRRGSRRLRRGGRHRRSRRAELRDRLRRARRTTFKAARDGARRARRRRRLLRRRRRRGRRGAEGACPAPATLAGATGTIADWLQAATAKTGENTQLRRFARLVAGEGNALTLYAHPGDKTVVVVETKGCDAELGRDLAMQVAALTPLFAVPRGRPGQGSSPTSARSRKAKAVAAGKPEAVAEKMVEGMIGKWYGEVVLVDQPFVEGRQRRRSRRSSPSARARTRPSSASSASRWAKASRRSRPTSPPRSPR